MPPADMKPYVKRQKNDAADAEAICEAVTRANGCQMGSAAERGQATGDSSFLGRKEAGRRSTLSHSVAEADTLRTPSGVLATELLRENTATHAPTSAGFARSSA
jgi:hypothetical protein